ncbi:MAG: hypothetical protein JW882_17160 [Deltaproteobacteria bacterium]|nr:hypothetical protein [Deltaproteobacteria bacterium]
MGNLAGIKEKIGQELIGDLTPIFTEATKIFLDNMNNLTPEDITRNLVIIDRNKTRIRKEKL